MWALIIGIVAGLIAGVAANKKLNLKASISVGLGLTVAVVVGSAVYSGAYWAYIIGVAVGVVVMYMVTFQFDEKAGIITGVIVAVLLGGYIYSDSYYNEREVTCTVKKMDRGQNSGGYRVYTTCGEFADADNWLRWKTNSATIWGDISEGGTYRFHVVGARRGIDSAFPNILSATPA